MAQDAGGGATRRWVKVQGLLILLLVVLVMAMSLGLVGSHGPVDHGGSAHQPDRGSQR